ncbi:hypothetical protein BDN71DRAFT_1396508, partial [Pleurotus eryngii]
IDYKDAINDYVGKNINHKLHKHKLDESDWQAIELVTSWLEKFQMATTQMSSTQCLMLSLCLTIF